MASVLTPLALVLLGGLNISYDFPELSMFGSGGRTGIHVRDQADASQPVFFVTRYESRDPVRFAIVHAPEGAPAAMDHATMTTEIRGGGKVTSVSTLCPRSQEVCHPVITAPIGNGAVATVTVIDYDASGKVIGRVTDRYELRRRWQVSSRFWDTMMSV
jgi:hypothetical protein